MEDKTPLSVKALAALYTGTIALGAIFGPNALIRGCSNFVNDPLVTFRSQYQPKKLDGILSGSDDVYKLTFSSEIAGSETTYHLNEQAQQRLRNAESIISNAFRQAIDERVWYQLALILDDPTDNTPYELSHSELERFHIEPTRSDLLNELADRVRATYPDLNIHYTPRGVSQTQPAAPETQPQTQPHELESEEF